jgi:hypothetical protein
MEENSKSMNPYFKNLRDSTYRLNKTIVALYERYYPRAVKEISDDELRELVKNLDLNDDTRSSSAGLLQ